MGNVLARKRKPKVFTHHYPPLWHLQGKDNVLSLSRKHETNERKNYDGCSKWGQGEKVLRGDMIVAAVKEMKFLIGDMMVLVRLHMASLNAAHL